MDTGLYENLKVQILKEAAVMRQINQNVPVSGERIELPAEGRTIPIVLYRVPEGDAPLVIGFHGGGYLFGGNALDDAMWKTVSIRLHCNLASVEYRKSPEYRWREALEDAYDAAVYLKDHAEAFGFSPEHISVMGGSAGAGLAASLCIYAKKKGGIRFENQILMYPFLDLATDPDSKGKAEYNDPIFYIFNELHCTPEEAVLPEVSPVFAKSEELEGLPHAIFCIADRDNLKYEGYRYAEMLKQAGITVEIKEFREMPHGFFEFGMGQKTEEDIQFLAEEAQELIRNGKMQENAQAALGFVAEHFRP